MKDGSISGLSEAEVAVVAHILAWMWRPWLPGPGGYKTALDSIQHLAQVSISYLT